MMNNPEILRALLEKLTDALITYVIFQIDSGAQVGSLTSQLLSDVTLSVGADAVPCFFHFECMDTFTCVMTRPWLCHAHESPNVHSCKVCWFEV